MNTFVNLENEELIECKIKPKLNIIEGTDNSELNIFSISKVSVDTPENEEELICIKECCDASLYYGCTNEYDGFRKENLFSELTDEYQRTIARINLGIADEYALKWGNIKGNIYKLHDLYEFVVSSIELEINKVIDDLNATLDLWAYLIKIAIQSKADIYSPKFQGEPTSTLPYAKDNSDRIATTEWVNARILANDFNKDLKSFKVTPAFKYIDENEVTVEVSWDYRVPITELSINNIKLDVNTRNYVFELVTSDFLIILAFTIEDKSYTEVYSFEVKYPIYYGTNPNIVDNNKTSDYIFNIDANSNQYIYIGIPNNENALLSVNGIIGGFVLDSSLLLYNTIYYVYKSYNAGLGPTLVLLNNYSNKTTELRLDFIEKELTRINNKTFISLENG